MNFHIHNAPNSTSFLFLFFLYFFSAIVLLPQQQQKKKTFKNKSTYNVLVVILKYSCEVSSEKKPSIGIICS